MRKNSISLLASGIVCLGSAMAAQAALPDNYLRAVQGASGNAEKCAALSLDHMRKNPASAEDIRQYASKNCGAAAALQLGMPDGENIAGYNTLMVKDAADAASAQRALPQTIASGLSAATTADQCVARALDYSRANPTLATAIYQHASKNCSTEAADRIAAGLAAMYPQRYTLVDTSSYASTEAAEAETGLAAAFLTSDEEVAEEQAILEEGKTRYNLPPEVVNELLRVRADSDECVDSVLDMAEENPSRAGAIGSYALKLCKSEDVAGPIAIGLAKMFPNDAVPMLTAMMKQSPALYAEIILSAMTTYPSGRQQQIFDQLVNAIRSEVPEVAMQEGFSDITLPGDPVTPQPQIDNAGLPMPDEISPN